MADDISIEELKSLSARDRVSKLKELEKKKRDEIEKVEKLLMQSEHDAKVEERIIEQVEVPESAPVDISSLFEQGGENLESQVGGGKSSDDENASPKYQNAEQNFFFSTYTAMDSHDHEPIPPKIDGALSTVEYAPTEGKKLADVHVASRSVLEETKRYSRH